MTFEQAFLKIKDKFKDADISKLSGCFAIQVNLTDEDCGGAFYIQFADGELNVEPYDYRDNTADITLKRLDFNKLLTGKLDIDKALSVPTLYINGNKENVLAISGLVKPTARATVKKATAKKSDAKKSEKPKKSASAKKTTAKKA